MAESVGDQAADGVEMLARERGAEEFVEGIDVGQRAHPPMQGFGLDDHVGRIVVIVFVFDFTDDLFEHVFDGEQAGDAAVFVDHEREVIAVAAKFAQQHIQPLGFGDEDRRAQHRAQRETVLLVIAQQVFGEQDADHVVARAVIDRKARVRGADHERNDLLGRRIDIDHVHLRALDHDVARAEFADAQHTFHHGKRIGVHQFALVRVVEHFEQLRAVFGLAQQQGREAFEEGMLLGGTLAVRRRTRSGRATMRVVH